MILLHSRREEKKQLTHVAAENKKNSLCTNSVT